MLDRTKGVGTRYGTQSFRPSLGLITHVSGDGRYGESDRGSDEVRYRWHRNPVLKQQKWKERQGASRNREAHEGTD